MKTEELNTTEVIQFDITPDFELPKNADHYDKHLIEAVVYKHNSKYENYKKGDIMIQLTHQCNEWKIGNIEKVDKLIEGLKYAQKISEECSKAMRNNNV